MFNWIYRSDKSVSIKKMFSKNATDLTTVSSVSSVSSELPLCDDTFKAAGCIFTDGKYALAGYQQNKGRPSISGLGGSKKNGETFMDTALRETLEELFEVYDIEQKLLKELKAISPRRLYQSDDYVSVIYSFDDLQRFLTILKRSTKVKATVLYKIFPKSVYELIHNRVIVSTSEISYLMLVPLLKHKPGNPFIDPLFLKDIATVKVLMTPTRFINIDIN